jgi:hypothetical protein
LVAIVERNRLAGRTGELGTLLIGQVEVAGLFDQRCEPARETRNRRERDEGIETRQFALQILGHLLDQEIAEGDAAQTLLAVRDRIEHGGRRRLCG